MTSFLIAFKKKLLFRLRYARHDGSSNLLGKDVEDEAGEKADVVMWMRTGVGTRKVVRKQSGL